MSEPKTMVDVLARIKAVRQQLEQAVGKLSEVQMTATVVYDGRTPKDILAHIAFWDQRIVHAVKPEGGADAFRLAPPVIADIPYSDQWTHTVNERIYQSNRQKPLAEVKAEFEQAYRDLIAVRQELFGQVAADKTSAAGNESVSHAIILIWWSQPSRDYSGSGTPRNAVRSTTA